MRPPTRWRSLRTGQVVERKPLLLVLGFRVFRGSGLGGWGYGFRGVGLEIFHFGLSRSQVVINKSTRCIHGPWGILVWRFLFLLCYGFMGFRFVGVSGLRDLGLFGLGGSFGFCRGVRCRGLRVIQP